MGHGFTHNSRPVFTANIRHLPNFLPHVPVKKFHELSLDNMSCCGGNCGCGASCKCANGCGGCKMHPDMSFSESTTTETLVLGVAPQKAFYEGSEMGVAAETGGCKCSPCTCNPCTCK